MEVPVPAFFTKFIKRLKFLFYMLQNIFNIDDMLEGKHTSKKLADIYDSLKREILPEN